MPKVHVGVVVGCGVEHKIELSEYVNLTFLNKFCECFVFRLHKLLQILFYFKGRNFRGQKVSREEKIAKLRA